MTRVLLALTLLAVVAIPAMAEDTESTEKAQNVEITNSYLNIKSINKVKDANVQTVKIDKCFLSIIRVNLGGKENPVAE